MNKIYRQVLSSERLPTQKGEYPTSKGILEFFPEWGAWRFDYKPRFWLEEVCLPDEIEFDGQSKIENCKDSSYNDGYIDGWDGCYEYIINKIQGGTV